MSQYGIDRTSPGTPNFRTVVAAAATLTEAQSGALLVFNLAAGYTITLPSNAPIGTWFDVSVDVTVTSVVARLACPTGEFLKGTIMQGADGTYVEVARTADGTTHLAWEGNGSTTGGIIGDNMQVIKDSLTTWRIRGKNTATGTEATPFKTS
jgi:hypothetical protein